LWALISEGLVFAVEIEGGHVLQIREEGPRGAGPD
jgi:hypothetical protein